MNEKASNKFFRRNGHNLPFATIFVVTPLKGDIAVVYAKDTIVRNSNPVGVSAEILNNTRSILKWFFAINNPFLLIE